MAEAGIDVLFTMLNGARAGAIDACRRCGITQIGNVIDWCSLVPDVFIASALARIDLAVQRAIQDAAAGVLPLAPCTLGLADDGAVGLKVATQDRRLTNYVQTAINRAEQALLTDSISLDNDYAGGEFSP